MTVNIRDITFGAQFDRVHDDAPNIQAAIDHAFSQNDGNIVIDPPGSARIASPIYLDPPNNLRSNLANPTQFSWTCSLTGSGGPGINTGSSTLWADFNDKPAFWVGTGQGVAVKGLAISGPSPGPAGFRRGLPSSGAGIAIAGGNGGPTRTLIENCSSNLLYTGIAIGANGNPNLADSTTIRKANITAALGIDIRQTNNLITSVEECVIDAVTGIQAVNWNGVRVRGGNFSTNLGGNTFPISGVSVATLQGVPFQTAYQITIGAVVGSPDALFLAGAYNAFALVTQHFGIVPMALTSYDPGTSIATFIVLDGYSGSYFAGWGNDPATKTNLAIEIEAATTLYAAELATTFRGNEMHVDGIHVENGSTPTTLLDGYFGGEEEGGGHNTLRSIRINGDLTLSSLGPSVVAGTASPVHQAQFYVSRSWPQLRVGYSETTLDSITMSATDERLIVDRFNPVTRFTWRGAGPKLMERCPISARPFTNSYNSGGPAAIGSGNFEANPFVAMTSVNLANSPDGWRGPWGEGRAPMRGVRPAPWATPGITPAQLATLLGTLPSISYGGAAPVVGYPLLWGGQIYRLQDWFLGTQPSYQLVSSHHFYTYGQPLAVSWSHMGQSPFLYVSDTRLMFSGLGIEIDHGDGPQLYFVTGVYPRMGMISVLKAVENDNGPWLLHGDKATVYTGATIGQEPFAITRF